MIGEIFYLIVIVVMGYILFRQQRTIDRLTDKLMARNYVEYKSMDKIKEEDASPPQDDDKRLSWHDN